MPVADDTLALLEAYLSASTDAKVYAATGDQLARAALHLADRARTYWKASRTLLDAAAECARELAEAQPDPDKWPQGLEARILAELDRRDAANDADAEQAAP